jgi:hypothetical protein
MTRSLGLAEISLSAREALALLTAYPLKWFVTVVVFLLAMESLMFIPYAGFLLKLYAGSLLGAQFLGLFALAESGRPPRLRMLLGAFSLPASTQLVLAACTFLSFFVGLSYLVWQGGMDDVAFFFGSILRNKPPSSEAFFIFKTVMYVAGLPFSFVAAAIVLKGESAWSGLAQGVVAAVSNWRALAALLAFSIAYEWSVGKLASSLPPAGGAAVSIVLLVAFLGCYLALGYALCVRVFGLKDSGGETGSAGVADSRVGRIRCASR